ncbi:hypothetical protein CCHR01_00885 [Colletotrichum chrysophilum]|uniref:Heterokaryon incompatibility domain-containing protein n=1 Tax=Colletotrichum chrysophilum TaxID=1836956 RepID=A0AAD9AXW3_9PEZI|nr:hypothetical protein CCHR01_00885 [Colletotrichum chrysophilum]
MGSEFGIADNARCRWGCEVSRLCYMWRLACKQPRLLAHHSSFRPAYLLDDISSKHRDTMSTTATFFGTVQLCTSCQLFQWPQLPIADGPDYKPDPPDKTFLLLEESAAAGCTLCQLFWCCIINSQEVAKRQTVRFLFDASLSIDVGVRHGGSFYISLRVEGMSVDSWSCINFIPLEADQWKGSEILEERQVKRFSPGTIFDDLGELVNNQILPWMKNCHEQQEDHSHCGPSSDSRIFPARLIDVGEGEDDLIRLIETGHKSVTNPYLILSYCWGQSNESAKTTRDNLESRLCRFSTTTLPKTIRDAIILTRMMGFRYLWVDAMCIIQATEDDPGDFELEAMRMREYYVNAECCIAASLARDSSEGFLTERPLGRFPVPRIASKLSSSITSQSVLLRGEEFEMYLKKALSASPLMERGWYLQELMLSRRILHWTLNGLYLECQSSNFIEGGLQKLIRYSNEPRQVLAVPDDEILAYTGWYQLIEAYSSKQLSYERDRLYAIHGIASLLVQRCGAEYFHGVFRSSIAQGLAWSYVGDDLMEVDNLDLRIRAPKHVGTQFPTWSWASNCPVYFHELEDVGLVRDDHPQRPPLFPVHPGNMSLTEGIDSRLYIRAPLIAFSLQRINNQLIVSTKDRRGKRINGQAHGSLDAQRSNQDDTLYDSFLTGLDEGIDILWLTLGLNADHDDWYWYIGLLVRRQGGTLYQRYGLLKINWSTDDVEDLFNTVEEIILE